MQLINLTNLGNLTLNIFNDINKRYSENADLKRSRMAKLWGSEEEMLAFMSLFSEYHEEAPQQVLVRKGDAIGVQDTILPDSISYYSPEITAFMNDYKRMGLISYSDSESDISSRVERVVEGVINNPAQNIRQAYIELTGRCNLKCRHCYRGGSKPEEKGLPVEDIKEALIPLLRAGIRSITITGGEPTLRKNDVIELVEFCKDYMVLDGISREERMIYRFGSPNPTIEEVMLIPNIQKMKREMIGQLEMAPEEVGPGMWAITNENTMEDIDNFVRNSAEWQLKYAEKPSTWDLDSIGILTNGYFNDKREFLKALGKYRGVHLQTSLDSFNGHRTNRNRGKVGVFGNVKELITIGDEEGVRIDITAHNIGGANTRREKENERYFDRSGRMWVLDGGMLPMGNAVQNGFKTRDTTKYQKKKHNYIGGLVAGAKAKEGWCTGWVQPEDIHIKPTGIVGNCLYAHALPEEMGSLHNASMEYILNHMQDTRVFEMFSSGRLAGYQYELDTKIFKRKFSSSCEPLVLTLTYALTKERMIEEGVAPEAAQKKANLEVARLYKYK